MLFNYHVLSRILPNHTIHILRWMKKKRTALWKTTVVLVAMRQVISLAQTFQAILSVARYCGMCKEVPEEKTL